MGVRLRDVIAWFLSRTGDRRQYNRRAGAFNVAYEPENGGPTVHAIGTEISASGMLFMTPAPIERREIDLSIGLEDESFPARVKLVRASNIDYQGRPWIAYACEFAGIGAQWWDLITRYVNDERETGDRRKAQNQVMSGEVDDAFRLLPVRLQTHMIDMLVERKRLTRPKRGEAALLKVFYGGLTKEDGLIVHRFNVHSRITVNDEAVAYDTRFLVGDDGSIRFG